MPTRPRNWFRRHAAAIKLTVLLAATVIAIFIGESICFVRFHTIAPDVQVKRMILSWAGEEFERPGPIIPHLYTYQQNRPDFHHAGKRQTNARGYRNPSEFPVEKPEGQIRVLAIGGSTTYAFPYMEDARAAWPGRLEAMLSQRYPDRDILVINAGQAAATTGELMSQFCFRHQHLQPDIVILHVGGNDRFTLLYPDYDPEYTHYRKRTFPHVLRKGETLLLKHSNMVRMAYVWWLSDEDWHAIPNVNTISRFGKEPGLQRVRDTEPIGFKRNVTTMVNLARANGAQVILLPFVQASDERVEHTFPGMGEALALALERHRQILRELARQREAFYIDVDQAAFPDEWFLDDCHLPNAAGHQLKAELVMECITSNAPLSSVFDD